MRFSRVFVGTAALALATAFAALPTQVASAQPPSTKVLVPSTGATVSGTQVVLDASASAGVTGVQFELTGGVLNDVVIATATPTIYGWIAVWNSSTAVIDGTYTLQSVATAEGSSGTSTGISIMVSNGAATVRLVLPRNGVATGTQAVLDAVGPAGVTIAGFVFSAPGCPPADPPYDTQPLCTFDATPTIYGWIAVWNSTEVPNGNYELSVICGNCPSRIDLTGMAVVNPAARWVLPAYGSTVAGSQLLDCVPPAGYDGVQFWIEGPSLSNSQFVGAATATYYGWLYEWNTLNVADGYYSIYYTAGSPSTGANAFSPAILVNVGN